MTGASGFVGRAVRARLSARGAYRSVDPGTADAVAIGDIGASTDWQLALSGIRTVVHLAARVHMMNDPVADPLAAFRAVNAEGTVNLARQAVDAGVRRLVFVSSIKVNGESTPVDRPFRADDSPSPQDPYALSKFEAEKGLREIERMTGLEVVVIRPPLVYGPGVGANFLAMLRWVRRGIPLPLGAIDNLRSLVALDNLVDLIARCVDLPAAAGGTWLVSDGKDVSTPELLHAVGSAMGRPPRLLPVPVTWLQLGAGVLGRRAMVDRLCESLRVDITPTREQLGWAPPVTMAQMLRRTVVAANLAGALQ